MSGRALALLLLSGCVTAQVYVPADDAARLERKLVGDARYLRVSMYVTPFFGDATRKLVTPVPPEQVRLLEAPDHTPINPGAIEKILPVGTPVRVKAVEFPSATVMAERVLYTPRSLLWVTIEAAGVRSSPLVLVLRPGLKTADEVQAELDRLVSKDDPSSKLEAFSEAVRDGVRNKAAVLDMPAEALEMAWGAPESRRIELVGTSRRETWAWPGKRSALLVDGRVTELKDH